ncbi:hypothetical protein ACSQ67_024816 [Phaseolus vulgaris]
MDTKKPYSPGRTRTRTSPCASPEFEFWMVRNPSFPQPHILSADQLFVNGVLLPLHLLNKPHQPHYPPDPEPSPPLTDSTSTSAATATASKRWKDIFKKKNAESSTDAKKKEKKTASPLQRSSTSTYGHSPGAGPRATRAPDPKYSLRRPAKRTARRARGAIRRESPSQGSGPAARGGAESI